MEDVDRRLARIERGDRLRAFIEAECELRNWTVADLARAMGLRTPSALYNLMHRMSHSLRMDSMTALGRVTNRNVAVLMDLPPVTAGEDVTQLVREATEAQASPAIKDILARMAARLLSAAAESETDEDRHSRLDVSYEVSAKTRRVQILPKAGRGYITNALRRSEINRRSFGVRVVGDAGAPLYPDGATLVCLPAKGHMAELLDGRRVVIALKAQGSTIQTIELRQVHHKSRKLLKRLSGGGDSITVPVPNRFLPPNLVSNFWQDAGRIVTVIGIVSSAIIPEISEE